MNIKGGYTEPGSTDKKVKFDTLEKIKTPKFEITSAKTISETQVDEE